MTFRYYADTDSLYINLADRPSAESEEVAPGVVIDYDAAGGIVGLDIQNASRTVDLSRVETHALPVETVAMSK